MTVRSCTLLPHPPQSISNTSLLSDSIRLHVLLLGTLLCVDEKKLTIHEASASVSA
jgi:hypothetical protein